MKQDCQSHWERIGLKAHHGISVPLFAIKSERSSGIGEFLDLILLIDWCHEIGFDTLQLLPINDTGKSHSPYMLHSSLALDPIYLSLKQLPHASLTQEEQIQFHELNQSPRLNRDAVYEAKYQWLYQYYVHHFTNLSQTVSYQTFLKKHQHWLAFYITFQKNYPSDFYAFLQFLCFSQMSQVKEYASEKKIYLMGDLPLFVTAESADIQERPSLFNQELHAGAPPDLYNPEGQNWGFPIFNYEAMEKDHFSWWKKRLKVAEEIYHIYRIDHVLGLFHIWAVPDADPRKGFFLPKDPDEWLILGKKILQSLLQFSPLFPIAEDLGKITTEIASTLKTLKICTTKVVRWELATPLQSYNPFSMTTISTHDMEPTPLWWKNHPEEAEHLAQLKKWPYHPDLSAPQILDLLKDAHATSSYFHINPLQEYLFLFPELHQKSLEEERINTPGVISPSNWSYRFSASLEEITSHSKLQKIMKTLTEG